MVLEVVVILYYCSSIPQTCMTSRDEEDIIYASSASVHLGEQEVISHDAATVYHSLFLASILLPVIANITVTPPF